jgi:hypothetical protein
MGMTLAQHSNNFQRMKILCLYVLTNGINDALKAKEVAVAHLIRTMAGFGLRSASTCAASRTGKRPLAMKAPSTQSTVKSGEFPTHCVFRPGLRVIHL